MPTLEKVSNAPGTLVATACEFVTSRVVPTSESADRLMVHRAKRTMVGGRIIKLGGIHQLFVEMSNTKQWSPA